MFPVMILLFNNGLNRGVQDIRIRTTFGLLLRPQQRILQPILNRVLGSLIRGTLSFFILLGFVHYLAVFLEKKTQLTA